ncbi:cuscuta receptor 1-like isoform X2 [Nicotiana tomentosiformis]|uniref:cuscuta receptor 1-like isoform X2 n=1 Tax=Nicotiana tomentosiformis TaxID=4098 RepID=UPI00388C67BC
MREFCLWMLILFLANEWCSCYGCWKEERIALLKLKENINYTNGAYFSTWVANETSNCCQWEGIICSNSSRKVTELSISVKTFIKKDISGIESLNTDNWRNWHFNASLFLPFKNLKALLLRGHSIANWIENEGFEKLKQLTKLEKLDLAGNNFNRSIFPSLSQLTSLKSLNLGRNNIESGNERLSGLSNLESLDLSVNRLNDESVLSALELGILRNIKYLLLDGNTLDKNFLQSSGVMPSLKVLSVSNCGLNGTLPIPGLCNLKYLEELSLSFNNFHGNLPPCLGNLTLLRVIDLTQNQFTGNIASSPLSSLLSLEYLLLKNNNFEIPISFESFANHSNLKYVIPDGNSLVVKTSTRNWIPKFQLEALSLTKNCSVIPNFLHYQHQLRQLSLSDCNIGGNFPNWLLENNPRLEEVYLDGNAFTGSLHELSFLPNMKFFDISRNKIQGQLPPNISSIFPNILRLKMSNNMLEGMLPSSFSDMKNLLFLDLADNKLSGDLPIELARNGLFFLRLSNNMLEGEIFPVSTNINNLQYLYLDGNNFSGSIPQKLSSASLSSLDLSNNSLSGNLPSWIGYIPSLTSLALSRNHLKGPIPADYCRLEKLEVLDLSRNNLVGVIPSCFSASQNLKRVYLSKNNLRGQFDVFSNSSDLTVLDLKDNNFTGSIPKWLGSIEINTLLLKGNHLQGNIPTELCHASELRIMDLSHNNLSGPIPRCFGNIIQIAGISEAYPYGPIFSYPRLQTWGRDTMVYVEDSMERSTVSYQDNYAWVGAEFTTKYNTYSYEGSIVDYMFGIDLSYNQLSGDIPKELCNLTEIRALNLSHNHITGAISSEFSNLQNIESLDLSYNNLTGRIPSQLVELTSLAIFSVAHNNLTGMTPQRTSQFATFTESSYQGNPFLCGTPLHINCMETKEIPISPRAPDFCEDDTGFLDMESFNISFLVAYANLVLVIAVVLWLNPYWRYVWFYYIESFMYSCYYLFASKCT